MPQLLPQALPAQDDTSEDTLERFFTEDPELTALLQPRAGDVVRGTAGKPIGLSPRVACAEPVSAAVIEDRR